MATVALVLDASFLKTVETLGRTFVLSAEQTDRSLVDCYADNYISFAKIIDEFIAFRCFLINRLVVEDNAAHVLGQLTLYRITVFMDERTVLQYSS